MGDIYLDMDLLHMENEPGSPISRELVESIRRGQHTTLGDERDCEDKDEDETFLEYHSPNEGNTSGEDIDDDSFSISVSICKTLYTMVLFHWMIDL